MKPGKRHIGLSLLLTVFLTQAVGGCTAGGGMARHTGTGLEPLQWLIGDWVAAGENHIAYESWERAGRDALAGLGRSKSRETGQTRVTETMRLATTQDGVHFIATVAHNPGPVAFPLTEHDSRRFVFENPQHDFPTRIVYEQLSENSMRVIVSGADGKGFTIEFLRAGRD